MQVSNPACGAFVVEQHARGRQVPETLACDEVAAYADASHEWSILMAVTSVIPVPPEFGLSRRTMLIALASPALVWLGSGNGETQEPQRSGGSTGPLQISGIYPHLAVFNDSGGEQDRECGIGAVVVWAGRLWLMTYPPHRRTGSPDKLYEIDDRLQMTVRPESVGGTHAGRMIHRESDQLVMGPYCIDAKGGVRAIDQRKGFPARITAVARHLIDPARKVYMVDMEGPIWEVDVRTLEATRLFVKPVPGWHAKGAYTAQGRLIVANNGELRTADLDKLAWESPERTWSKGPEDAGVLAEYDGKAWTIVARRPHTEVTGPGGLTGESAPDAPVWSVGWDKRSVLLQVRSGGAWHTYRLPKGSYTYDPSHGWFTEWPRIRAIGDGPLLLNMHGTFFDFPPAFDAKAARGVRPLGTHLHYTTDFTEWNGRVVLAGDDTSILQNLLASKPQSNLRFVSRASLATDFGPRSGWGGVWVDDAVTAGRPSDAVLVAGYDERCLHLAHNSRWDVAFSIDVDRGGDGSWQELRSVHVPAAGYVPAILDSTMPAEWLRVRVDRDCTATAFLHLSSPQPSSDGERALFASLAPRDPAVAWTGGLLRPAGFSRTLQFLARRIDASGQPGQQVYYEIDERLAFARVDAPDRVADLERAAEPSGDYAVDAASVLVTDAAGRRWRLPRGRDSFSTAGTRGVREVVSERYLAHIHGTFYEIPRLETKTVPDYRRMKPVASHAARIADFATWRGLLVIAGTRRDAVPDGHYFAAGPDGDGLWFGAVDDLYKLGQPAGEGGPLKETPIEPGVPSDPFLMTGFGRKSVTLSHDRDRPVRFTIEVDFLATDAWYQYATVDVPAGEAVVHRFPGGFAAHWVRLKTDATATATAWFSYG